MGLWAAEMASANANGKQPQRLFHLLIGLLSPLFLFQYSFPQCPQGIGKPIINFLHSERKGNSTPQHPKWSLMKGPEIIDFYLIIPFTFSRPLFN
jgi:hypothetical protein